MAKRLTRHIVLTRLLVGHTHEDIDAIFAIIWQHMKNNTAMTPQTYATLVAHACRNKASVVDVKDLWAVPDYQTYFTPFINPKLGRYAKGEHVYISIQYFVYVSHHFLNNSQGNGRSCKLFSMLLILWMLRQRKNTPWA